MCERCHGSDSLVVRINHALDAAEATEAAFAKAEKAQSLSLSQQRQAAMLRRELAQTTIFSALDDPAFEPHPVLNTAVIGQLTGAAAARLALVQRHVTRGSDRRPPWGRARPTCAPVPINHCRNRPLLSCKPPDRRDINLQSEG